MGHTDVVVDRELVLDEAYAEWHAGVLRADKPAERAMCSNGRGGKDSSS